MDQRRGEKRRDERQHEVGDEERDDGDTVQTGGHQAEGHAQKHREKAESGETADCRKQKQLWIVSHDEQTVLRQDKSCFETLEELHVRGFAACLYISTRRVSSSESEVRRGLHGNPPSRG
ncbi:hypothetical protein [Halovenus salina]|uniref:Uncharacterized protein n=1 Tax=Halovenus salina TaxID=1510225 RepID=A0ABD5W7G4_9EURY